MCRNELCDVNKQCKIILLPCFACYYYLRLMVLCSEAFWDFVTPSGRIPITLDSDETTPKPICITSPQSEPNQSSTHNEFRIFPSSSFYRSSICNSSTAQRHPGESWAYRTDCRNDLRLRDFFRRRLFRIAFGPKQLFPILILEPGVLKDLIH
jgi:hypothetical protein